MPTITFDLDEFTRWIDDLAYSMLEDISMNGGTVTVNVANYFNDHREEPMPSTITGNIDG
jgi:hypothetical protein